MAELNDYGGGKTGLSAYELYVELATEAGDPVLPLDEWLASLEGDHLTDTQVDQIASASSQHFATRAAFTSATIPSWVTSWTIGTLRYVRDTSGTAVTSANGVKGSPDGDVYAEHFADPVGAGGNDTAAFAAALSWSARVVGAPGKTYILGDLGLSGTRRVLDLRGCTVKRLAGASRAIDVTGAFSELLIGTVDTAEVIDATTRKANPALVFASTITGITGARTMTVSSVVGAKVGMWVFFENAPRAATLTQSPRPQEAANYIVSIVGNTLTLGHDIDGAFVSGSRIVGDFGMIRVRAFAARVQADIRNCVVGFEIGSNSGSSAGTTNAKISGLVERVVGAGVVHTVNSAAEMSDKLTVLGGLNVDITHVAGAGQTVFAYDWNVSRRIHRGGDERSLSVTVNGSSRSIASIDQDAGTVTLATPVSAGDSVRVRNLEYVARGFFYGGEGGSINGAGLLSNGIVLSASVGWEVRSEISTVEDEATGGVKYSNAVNVTLDTCSYIGLWQRGGTGFDFNGVKTTFATYPVVISDGARNCALSNMATTIPATVDFEDAAMYPNRNPVFVDSDCSLIYISRDTWRSPLSGLVIVDPGGVVVHTPEQRISGSPELTYRTRIIADLPLNWPDIADAPAVGAGGYWYPQAIAYDAAGWLLIHYAGVNQTGPAVGVIVVYDDAYAYQGWFRVSAGGETILISGSLYGGDLVIDKKGSGSTFVRHVVGNLPTNGADKTAQTVLVADGIGTQCARDGNLTLLQQGDVDLGATMSRTKWLQYDEDFNLVGSVYLPINVIGYITSAYPLYPYVPKSQGVALRGGKIYVNTGGSYIPASDGPTAPLVADYGIATLSLDGGVLDYAVCNANGMLDWLNDKGLNAVRIEAEGCAFHPFSGELHSLCITSRPSEIDAGSTGVVILSHMDAAGDDLREIRSTYAPENLARTSQGMLPRGTSSEFRHPLTGDQITEMSDLLDMMADLQLPRAAWFSAATAITPLSGMTLPDGSYIIEIQNINNTSFRAWLRHTTSGNRETREYHIYLSSGVWTAARAGVYLPGDGLALLDVAVVTDMSNSLIYKGRIPAAANLNDYTEPGVWRINSGSDAATMANCPNSASGAVLECLAADPIAARGNARNTVQRWTTRRTSGAQGACPRVYLRSYDTATTAWGAWVEQVSLVETGTDGGTGATWEKWSDGRMICRGVTADFTTSEANGTGYRGAGQAIVFPQTFAAAPMVIPVYEFVSGSLGNSAAVVAAVTTTGTTLRGFSFANNSVGRVRWKAEGRWF